MSVFVSVLVALSGIAAIVIGSVFFHLFRWALRVFDQSLGSELASQSREQIERAAMKISNPIVRRIVLKHVVTAGGALAVAVARGAIESRKRLALYVAIAGVVMFVGSFFVGASFG